MPRDALWPFRAAARNYEGLVRQREDAMDHLRALVRLARGPWSQTNPAALAALALHLREQVSRRMHQYRQAMGILSDGIRDAQERRRDCLARCEARAQEARQPRRVVYFHLRRFVALERFGFRRLRAAGARFRARACHGAGEGGGSKRFWSRSTSSRLGPKSPGGSATCSDHPGFGRRLAPARISAQPQLTCVPPFPCLLPDVSYHRELPASGRDLGPEGS